MSTSSVEQVTRDAYAFQRQELIGHLNMTGQDNRHILCQLVKMGEHLDDVGIAKLKELALGGKGEEQQIALCGLAQLAKGWTTILSLAKHKNLQVTELAVAAIGEHPAHKNSQEAMPFLYETYQAASSDKYRCAVIYAIGRHAKGVTREGVELCITAAASDSKRLRVKALVSLSQIALAKRKYSVVINLVIGGMREPDPYIRGRLVDSLGQLAARYGGSVLKELNRMIKKDKDLDVKRRAVASLRYLRPHQGMPIVRELLMQKDTNLHVEAYRLFQDFSSELQPDDLTCLLKAARVKDQDELQQVAIETIGYLAPQVGTFGAQVISRLAFSTYGETLSRTCKALSSFDASLVPQRKATLTYIVATRLFGCESYAAYKALSTVQGGEEVLVCAIKAVYYDPWSLRALAIAVGEMKGVGEELAFRIIAPLCDHSWYMVRRAAYSALAKMPQCSSQDAISLLRRGWSEEFSSHYPQEATLRHLSKRFAQLGISPPVTTVSCDPPPGSK